MLKHYLKSNVISIYSLAKTSGIPYSTLNDLANGKVSIDNCKVGLLHALSEALGLTMDEMYSLAQEKARTYLNAYDVPVALTVRGKTYYALFEYQGDPVELEMCKVNDDTTYYIEEILKWSTERYIRERRMNDF